MEDVVQFACNTFDICDQIIHKETGLLLALLAANTIPYGMLGMASAYFKNKSNQKTSLKPPPA